MHIFGYLTDGFQSLNHSVVLNSLVFWAFWLFTFLTGSVLNRLWHMLADSVLQTLRRSTHVPTIAVAHVFIYKYSYTFISYMNRCATAIVGTG